MGKKEEANETKGAPEQPLETDATSDVFIASEVFPDAASIFTVTPLTLAQTKDDAYVVLDTNPLLVPYGIGPQTLAEIERTYRILLKQQRLIIPAQVAREFARNRVKKLGELYSKVTRRSELKNFQQGSYPLLEEDPEYKKARELEKKLDNLLKQYKEALGRVADVIGGWEWNDPVSVLYNKLFTADTVLDLEKPLDEIRKEHLNRFSKKIPPGYKDGRKADEGIGDFLIWLAVLQIGAKEKKSVIFVSGEEKADWWHKSEGQTLYPRYELVDEFRRASGGKSIHIVKLSQLLELFGASKPVVEAVREEEAVTVPLSAHSEHSLRRITAERAVAVWLMKQGYRVSGGSRGDRYDFLVEKDGEQFGAEIVYGSVAHVVSALRHRCEMFRQNRPTVPVTVIVAAENEEVARAAEKRWNDLDPPFRLCTLLLAEDGEITVVRPL